MWYQNRSVAQLLNRRSSIHSPNLGCACDRAICDFGLDLQKMRYIRQICIIIIRFFVASIGEVCNCRQKQGVDWVVSKSIARTSIGEVRNCRQNQGGDGWCENRSVAHRSVKVCNSRQKTRWYQNRSVAPRSVKCVTVVKN